jgi:type I restriction enzyme S subunit
MGSFIRGLTYTPGDVADSGLLVLRSGNIQDGSLVFDKDLVFVEKACTPDLLLRVGDVVICMSNGSKALVGKSAEYRDGYSGEVTIGAFCSLFRPSNPFSKIAFRSEQYSDFIADSIMGGNINNLKNSSLEGFPFPVPPTKAEQQKIAECLSSVDELMAAQARKVEALKTHKKGLMQQLFPREGETQPRLRFPEFRNAGEWEDGELGPKASKVGSGITPTGGDKNYKQVGRPFVRSQNVGWGILLLDDVAYIDEETHASFDSTEIKVSDVLLNITGASIGRSAVADERVAGGNVNQHVCIIRTKPDELNPFFLNQFLISQRGQKQIDSFQAGGNRQGLNFAQIRSFAVPRPPTLPEQQRIASCLTSLDALITAETQQLEALKTHKKGLMQQLFPSPEEVEG